LYCMALALDLGTLNKRLKREKAKVGKITASLIWNDPSDLDLYAKVELESGGQVMIGPDHDHEAAGGRLDVDANLGGSDVSDIRHVKLEPVENIFWRKPAAGKYEIKIVNFGTRCHPTAWGGRFTDKKRAIPFKVYLKKDGKISVFCGAAKHKQWVSCFKFTIANSSGHGGGGGGVGGGGKYLVFPPAASSTTFKDLCAKFKVTWKQGSGYYAVARTEKIQAYKEMLLQNVRSDKFTVGQKKCRRALGWPAGELKKGPKDIMAGHRLFVQSTSANRVVPPGTHVLFEVTAEEYTRHRKAKSTKFESETHTTGMKGMSAKAKAKATAAAKAKGKAKAKAKGRAPPKAGSKRAASPSGASKKKAHA